MAVEIASMKAVVDVDKKNFDKGMRETKESLSGMGLAKTAAGFLGIAAGVGVAVGALTAVTSVVGSWVSAAREAVQINKQLEQVIKSTNGIAGVSADMAREQAAALSMVTNFQDDAIVQAEAILLRYQKIGSDVFPGVTEATLDMAASMGIDLVSAANKLGPAFDKPFGSMARLEKLGIRFTAEQKKMMEQMKATNDVAGAQGIILESVNRVFGGSAKAMADPFIMMQNAIGEVQESLGMALLPILTQLATAVIPGIRAAAEVAGPALATMGTMMGEALLPVLTLLRTALVDITGSFGFLGDSVRELAESFGLSGDNINLFKIALLPLMIPLGILAGVLEGLSVVVNALGGVFQGWAIIINGVKNNIFSLTDSTGALNRVGQITVTVLGAISRAYTTLTQIITILKVKWDQLVASMSQGINLPSFMTPGSPTPLELGLKGINRELAMIGPNMRGFVGNIPTSSGVSTVNNTSIVNVGSVSATSQTMGDPATETLRMAFKEIKRQLGK